jgi:multiple sugar transport system substrate-binding protein
VHGDPTFMVMENLKRQFEQIVGTDIHQRAFSIDRLHQEILRNAERKHSAYDLIAVDLPWLGEFVEKGVIRCRSRRDGCRSAGSGRFHTAGWRATHWDGVPYGVPSQTTPELAVLPQGLVLAGGAGAAGTRRRCHRGGASFPRTAQRALRRGLERGPRHGAGPYLHDDLRRLRAADHRPARGGRRLAADRLGTDDHRPMLNTDRALEAAPNT